MLQGIVYTLLRLHAQTVRCTVHVQLVQVMTLMTNIVSHIFD